MKRDDASGVVQGVVNIPARIAEGNCGLAAAIFFGELFGYMDAIEIVFAESDF